MASPVARKHSFDISRFVWCFHFLKGLFAFWQRRFGVCRNFQLCYFMICTNIFMIFEVKLKWRFCPHPDKKWLKKLVVLRCEIFKQSEKTFDVMLFVFFCSHAAMSRWLLILLFFCFTGTKFEVFSTCCSFLCNICAYFYTFFSNVLWHLEWNFHFCLLWVISIKFLSVRSKVC